MKKFSICAFGSKVRKDFDQYSDKDLLIVSDDTTILSSLKDNYESKGWSTSTYTYKKLAYLAHNGSLFIHHLKTESDILVDESNELSTILKKFRLKDNYHKELVDDLQFFSAFTSVNEAKLAYAWLIDLFCVGFRNYYIHYYANKGLYIYSFKAIIQQLLFENQITKLESNILMELRIIKRMYRCNTQDIYPDKSYCIDVVNILTKLGLVHTFSFQSHSEFKHSTVNTLKNKQLTSYQRLRLIEGLHQLDTSTNTMLGRYITNPQAYTFLFSDDEFVNDIIDELGMSNPEKSFSYSRKGLPCGNNIT